MTILDINTGKPVEPKTTAKHELAKITVQQHGRVVTVELPDERVARMFRIYMDEVAVRGFMGAFIGFVTEELKGK